MTTKKTTFDKKGHLNETSEVLELRKMRSDQYVRSERTASFIATTNSLPPADRPDGLAPLHLLSRQRHHRHRADRQLPSALCPGTLRT